MNFHPFFGAVYCMVLCGCTELYLAFAFLFVNTNRKRTFFSFRFQSVLSCFYPRRQQLFHSNNQITRIRHSIQKHANITCTFLLFVFFCWYDDEHKHHSRLVQHEYLISKHAIILFYRCELRVYTQFCIMCVSSLMYAISKIKT